MSEHASGVLTPLADAGRLLPFYDTAKALGIAPATARRLRATGQIETIKLGKQILAHEAAFRGLLASLQHKKVAA